jgi:hypothetical protein
VISPDTARGKQLDAETTLNEIESLVCRGHRACLAGCTRLELLLA